MEFKQTLKEIAESKTKVVFVSGEGLAEMQIFINGLYEKEVPEMIHLHPGCEYTTIIEQNCRRFTKFATTDKSLRPDHYIEL